MDELDLAILREICRDKIFWWGGLDPRVSTEVIADRLKVAGSTVRARIAHWEKSGFLRGYDVIPNPALLGANLAGGSVRVESVADKRRVLEDLALVEGMKMAMDHVGPWLAIMVVSQTPRDVERTRALIARLPGVAEVSPCRIYHGPSSSMVPTPLDWRLLAALRAAPRARVQDIAKTLRVSSRTVTRRYDALVKANAVMFWLVLDFSKYPGVVGRFIIDRDPAVPRSQVAAAMRARFPDAVELWPPHDDVKGYDALDLFLYRQTVPEMEEAELVLRGLPGVTDVELLFPRSMVPFGDWIDARIAAILDTPRPA